MIRRATVVRLIAVVGFAMLAREPVYADEAPQEGCSGNITGYSSIMTHCCTLNQCGSPPNQYTPKLEASYYYTYYDGNCKTSTHTGDTFGCCA